MARVPVISRTVTSYVAVCTVVNKETGETSRREIITTTDSDKARNAAIEAEGLQLCYTHSVNEKSGVYTMTVSDFLANATYSESR